MKRFTILSCIVLVLSVFLSNPLFGDVFLKQKAHVDAFEIMGQKQPAKDEIESIWITSKGVLIDSKSQAKIIFFQEKKMIIVNHTEKTYIEMPMDFDDLAKEMGVEDADKAQMQAMMSSMMNVKVSVTKTGEKKKIGKWNCEKYIQKMEMAMGTTTTELWATEDIKIDVSLYSKFSISLFADNPMLKNALSQLQQEMKKIKGVTVLSKSTQTIMGTNVNSSQEVIEAKEGKAPANIFKIPSGYKKTKPQMGM